MSTEVETRPIPRKATRGPEPLRRKRVEPAPRIGTTLRRKGLNIILGFAAAVLMIDALVGEKGLLEGLRAGKAYEEAEASLTALKAENARLRDRMRRLNEDRSAVEALAREELGYIRPGEVLFIIRDTTAAARTSSSR
jgi:cell division protein FtsB